MRMILPLADRRATIARSALGWLLFASPLAGQPGEPPERPYSPRYASYDIDVTLDDEAKRLDGRVVLTWKNPSDDRISELQFHLYTNGFKNAKSTFIRELLHSRAVSSDSGTSKKIPWDLDDGWGWLRITKMTVNGDDVTSRISAYQPDDGNVDDESVVRVTLPTAIPPRGTARIDMTIKAKIPQCKRRTGWFGDDFLLLSHWIPKIGVYETPGMRFVPADAPQGEWNCHQFHAATEFYSDYGVYDVRITLPEDYVIGTSGQILDVLTNDDGTKTVIARAEDVHEFSWVADAQFREATDVWRSARTGQEVSVRLLYQPDHEALVSKYFEAVIATLEHVDNWLGPYAYPYPNLTVVDPRKGSSAGGMEYPNLITGGGNWWMEMLFGDGLRRTESVTIHEFMHQIWYGSVGSNEFEEAWLDEGFTTYSQNRIMSDLYGESTSWMNWWGRTGGVIGRRRASLAGARSRNDGSIADWTFAHWNTGIGRTMAYSKASLMLHTLENYLGRERFDDIMRTYYQRWRFKHPCRNDFVAVVNEVAGQNLDWFFDPILNERSSLDYAVASIANVPVDALEKGIFGDAEELPAEDPEDAASDDPSEADGEEQPEVFESTVVFRRIGEIVFPMDTVVEFSDGHVEWGRWDGRDRVQVLRFTRPAKVVRAAIDPKNLVPLDIDRFNNSKRIEANRLVKDKYTLKSFFWMQSFLQIVAALG